jgi:hypothetical protein
LREWDLFFIFVPTLKPNNMNNKLTSSNIINKQYGSYASALRAIKIVERRENITLDRVSINQLDENCFEII